LAEKNYKVIGVKIPRQFNDYCFLAARALMEYSSKPNCLFDNNTGKQEGKRDVEGNTRIDYLPCLRRRHAGLK
jgi:hypothetical protein